MFHRSSVNGMDLTRLHSRSSVAGMEAAQQVPQVVLKQNFNVTLPRMLQRRNAVSAESSRPGELGDANFVVQTYPKSQLQRARIQEILSGIVLFQGVSDVIMKDLVGGFFEMKYNDGDKIIVQGDVIAERFFLLESGQCDIFVKKGTAEPIKVHTVLPGGFFGELALLYNAPRAATVVSVGESKLWALDRGTFKNCMARASKAETPALATVTVASAPKPPPATPRSRSSIDMVNDQVLKVSDPNSQTSHSIIPTWNQIIKAKMTGGRDGQFPDTINQFLLKFKYPNIYIYKIVDMDATNTETMLYADARPKQVVFLPACSVVPTSISNSVELRGPHMDGTLTLKFANPREVNVLLDIFEKSTTFFGASQDAFKEVKYVAAGGNASDIRKQDLVNSSDIHGVGLILALSRNGKSITVRDIVPGSPAALCDSVISVHDHLLKVDDVDLKHSCSSLEDVAKLIRGMRGTSVKLVLRRSHDLQVEQIHVTENRPRGETEVRQFDSAILMHAKAKYEVVLKREPPVEVFTSGDASESKVYDVEENAAAIPPNDENKSVGSADGAVSNVKFDARESASSEQPEITLLKEQLDSLELKAPSPTAIDPSAEKVTHDCVIPSLRAVHSTDELSHKSDGPYTRLLQYAGKMQARARLTNSDVLELCARPLSSRTKEVGSRHSNVSMADKVEENAAAMLSKEKSESVGSANGAGSCVNANARKLAPREQPDINLLKEQLDSLGELKTPIPSNRALLSTDELSRKSHGPWTRNASGQDQTHAQLTNPDMLEFSAWQDSSRANESENRDTSEKNLETFLAEIGIIVSADDRRYVVQSIHPNAPCAVRNGVCARDEVMSVDGEDVRRASPNDIKAMLERRDPNSNVRLALIRNDTIIRIVAKTNKAIQNSSVSLGIPVAAGFSILKTDNGKFTVTEVAAFRQQISVGDVIISFGDHVFSPSDSLDHAAQIFDDELIRGDGNFGPTKMGKQLVVTRQTGSRSQTQFKVRIQPAHPSSRNQWMPGIKLHLSDYEKIAHSQRGVKVNQSISDNVLPKTSFFDAAAELDDEATQDISIGEEPYDSDDTQDMSLQSSSALRPNGSRELSSNVTTASAPVVAHVQNVPIPEKFETYQELGKPFASDPSLNHFKIPDVIETLQELEEPFVPDPSLNHLRMAGAARKYAADFRAKRVYENFAAAFRKKPPAKKEAQLSRISLAGMLFTRSLSVETENRTGVLSGLKNVNAATGGENWKKARDHRAALDFGAAFRRKQPVAESGSVERDELSLKKMLFG